MKKILVPFALFCVLCCSSCNRRNASLESLIMATVSDSVQVFPEALTPEDGVSANAFICLEIPQKGLRGKALRKIRKSIVSEALGEEYADMNCADAVSACLGAYAQNYLSDAREIAGGDDTQALLHTLNYAREINGEVVSLQDGILAYRISIYDYAGGAHGTYTENWLNFRASDGTSLRPELIFTENGRETLDYLLKTELQAGGHSFWNYEGAESAWLDRNFFFEQDSIRFYYNPYEVDCYAAGPVCVALPLELVVPLLDEKKLKLNLENSDE